MFFNYFQHSIQSVFASLRLLVEVITSSLHCQWRHTPSQISPVVCHSLESTLLVTVSSASVRFIQTIATSGALSSDQLSRCYGNILRISAALLSVHDIVSLSQETLWQFAWLASLPWIPNDLDLDDLKVSDGQEIKAHTEAQVREAAIQALPIFLLHTPLPADIIPTLLQ
ncbi:hypothetical protein NP493_91g01029 [Ridgeia piscesae]|uniref:Uncharacterized protein n=1 Tax=Ridgeia piscesae TaxID=27915 RepID=A0AAD9P8D9_RIDPI|nr:hypothetical protein NP493_91g01029 [Ridgeia piscesae]